VSWKPTPPAGGSPAHRRPRALIRTALISSVANRVMAETAAMPQAAAPDLVEAMLQRAAQDGFPPPSAALSDRQPHPTDTHPSTIARIEALGLTADEYLLSRAGRPIQADELDRARGLFADWVTLCRDLSADAVEFATQQHSNHQAALRRAAHSGPRPRPRCFRPCAGWRCGCGCRGCFSARSASFSPTWRLQSTRLIRRCCCRWPSAC
jgi:hypothetical protein